MTLTVSMTAFSHMDTSDLHPPNQGWGGGEGEGACFRIFKTQVWKPVARLWMTEDTIIYSSTEDNVHQSNVAIVMFAMCR